MRRLPAVPVLALAALATLAGCTRHAWYESARAAAEQQCQRGPAAAYHDCMARQNDKSFEEYRREREALRQAP